jgi:hypothetical protein
VAFRDAINELILAAEKTTIDAIAKDVQKRIDAVAAHSMAKASSEPIHKYVAKVEAYCILLVLHDAYCWLTIT